jgi:hypothetical protein
MTGVTTEAYQDFQRHEYVLALLLAMSVPIWATLALRNTGLEGLAVAPAIVAGDAVPIRVKPVIDFDSPLLKLGGKRKVKLPDMWAPPPKPVAKKRVVRKAYVSSKAVDVASAAAPADLPLAAASEVPPDASAEVIREQDEDLPEAETKEEPQAEGPGASDGAAEGTEVDPLKARAASMYAGRIRQFLRQRFHVAICTKEMAALSVGWSAVLAGGGQVTSCQISPSGNGALDGAAQAACASSQGQQIPPPENYPEFGSRSVGGRFRCQVSK